MPRLSYLIVDGLAFVLIAIGLVAAVTGYVRDRSGPEAGPVAAAMRWADPAATGAISPRR